MKPTQQWRPVVGHEGQYEVSDQGRVYSAKTNKILKAGMNRRHRHVSLYDGGRKTARVHRLVMESFVGPCPAGMECRHLDDDPDNNRLENLTYGTRSENMLDRVSNGTHHNAIKTHCVHGHEFTAENTLRQQGGRRCRECHRVEGVARSHNSDSYKGYVNNKDKTHCKNGHEFSAGNTRLNARGARECKACRADDQRRQRTRKRARLNVNLVEG